MSRLQLTVRGVAVLATGLAAASALILAMPAPARALGYMLAPGATFEPSGAPPGGALPLAGSFDLAAWGVCPLPCEPNAYGMMNVVLSTGGNLLSSGVVESIHAGLVISGPAFEVLPDDSVQTGFFPIERTIIETGILTDDPHNHTDYETFIERSLGILIFLQDDPKEVIHSDPRGTWPIELTLAYTLIEKTGTARFGWDGTGSIYLNEIVDSQSEVLGYTTFTAHPIPEPSTALLLTLGLVMLALKRRRSAREDRCRVMWRG
jgi:hypothetical protein